MKEGLSFSEMKRRLQDNAHPVILEFWAPWCGPCKAMTPALEKARDAHQGKVDVWKLNADEEPDLARAFGVWAVPTLIVFREGEEIKRTSGAQSPTVLNSLFEAALTGVTAASAGVSVNDRLLRIVVGLVLLAIGVAAGPSLLLIALAGIVLFSGVHDRCPVWQALRPRITRFGRRANSTQ